MEPKLMPTIIRFETTEESMVIQVQGESNSLMTGLALLLDEMTNGDSLVAGAVMANLITEMSGLAVARGLISAESSVEKGTPEYVKQLNYIRMKYILMSQGYMEEESDANTRC